MRRRPLLLLSLLLSACVEPVKSEDDVATLADTTVGDLVDPEPPEIVAVSPPPDAFEVELEAAVVVTFSTDIDSASITPSTFQVLRDGRPIDGTLVYDPTLRTMRFEPTAPFVRNATYEVFVGAGIRSAFGRRLAHGRAWTFTSALRTWDHAIRLDSDVVGPVVSSTDLVGTMHVFWRRVHSDGVELWVRTYDPQLGWTPARALGRCSDSLEPPRVFTNNTYTVATWSCHDGQLWPILVSRYDARSGWSAPEMASTGTTHINTEPDAVVTQGVGYIYVVWLQRYDEPNDNTVWLRVRKPSGWDPPIRVEHEVGNVGDPLWSSHPRLAIDGGLAIYWQQEDRDDHALHLWGRRYWSSTVPAAWESPRQIDGGTGGGAVDVVADDRGRHTLLWSGQRDGAPVQWTARLDDNVWTTPEVLSEGLRGASVMLAEPDGVVRTAWTQYDASLRGQIWGNQFDPGLGTWGTSTRLDDGRGRASHPSISLAYQTKTTFAVWEQGTSEETTDIVGCRWIAGLGWGVPSRVERFHFARASDAHVGAQPEGGAIAVWRMPGANGADDLWTSSYR